MLDLLYIKQEIYQHLLQAVKMSNIGVLNPYAIKRGTDIQNWVLNYNNEYTPF